MDGWMDGWMDGTVASLEVYIIYQYSPTDPELFNLVPLLMREYVELSFLLAVPFMKPFKQSRKTK